MIWMQHQRVERVLARRDPVDEHFMGRRLRSKLMSVSVTVTCLGITAAIAASVLSFRGGG
jgi:hypothetical protein